MRRKEKRAAVPVGVERDEIFTHYISLYADWCQIRASDWIELGREPRRRKKKKTHKKMKVVCGFIFPYSAEQTEK